MSCLYLLRSIALAAALAGSACARRSSPAVSWEVKFGPVLGNELIVGHVVDGRTAWLATGGDTLVRVDLASARHTRTAIHPLREGEHIWGLASTREGEMWTLIGRATLAKLGESAEIVRRIGLAEPHVGVFGGGRDLVFQIMDLHPPGHALAAGPPGGATRHPWSAMRTRDLPFTRGAVAALNLVSCGPTAAAVIPCWFPDTATLTLTDRAGMSREIPLDGLPIVAPELLLASDNPRRPVRDAFVTAGNMVWVLGSGEPPEGDTSTRPGGWLLARYDLEGRLFRRVQLPEPARIFLGAREDTCLLLAWDGRVVEVRL
jgi:hypothetical protein